MLTRFLLIGVGGSGGKTMRYCWRELDRKLEAAGWTEGLPKAWQFLHIDVPEIPDGIEGDVPADVGMEYLGLARQPRRYADFDRDLVTSDPAILPAIAGWRTDPTLPYAPPYNGAGQRRTVGRVVTVTEIDRIGKPSTAPCWRCRAPTPRPSCGASAAPSGKARPRPGRRWRS